MSEEPVKRRYDASPRRAAAAATRERICAAAEELFLRDGYARTSIRAVAQAAGVAEATVYLAFPNKAALLDAVILRAVARQRVRAPGRDRRRARRRRSSPRLAASNAVLMARAAPAHRPRRERGLMDADLRPMRERAHRGCARRSASIADRLDEAGLLRAERAGGGRRALRDRERDDLPAHDRGRRAPARGLRRLADRDAGGRAADQWVWRRDGANSARSATQCPRGAAVALASAREACWACLTRRAWSPRRMSSWTLSEATCM